MSPLDASFKGALNQGPLLGKLRQRCRPHAEMVYQLPPKASRRPAAVFAPLVVPHWEATLESADMLFIKRSRGLRRHAGQIAFPGGIVESQDASLLDAGFRESHEEVGLRPESVEILCPLPAADIPSGFQLYPYFVITDQRKFVADPTEVEAIYQVPVIDLLQCPFRLEYREWMEKKHRVVYFDLPELCVWGVTGRIVEYLLETFFDWEAPR